MSNLLDFAEQFFDKFKNAIAVVLAVLITMVKVILILVISLSIIATLGMVCFKIFVWAWS